MSLDAEALPTHPDNIKGDNFSNLPTYTNSTVKIYTIVTMVAHFVCILLTSFVAYVSKPGSSLFSWHPTLMTMSFTFFMMEGILFFSPQSSILQKYSRRTKSTAHWITMVLAIVCMIVGQMAVGITKERAGKAHLTTWHGVMGATTILYSIAQAFGGTFQLWGLLRKMLPKSVTLGKLKAYHATSGLILYMLACVTVFLGMMSTWFTTQVTGTSWYACAACPMVLLFIAATQITNAYLPKK